MNKESLVKLLVMVGLFSWGIVIGHISTGVTYHNKGYNKALDTVQKMIHRQTKDTTKITKIRFERKLDTLTYTLKHK